MTFSPTPTNTSDTMTPAPSLALSLPTGNIQGAALREFLRWYRARSDIAAFIARLPSETRAEFDLNAEGFGVLATQWYPAAKMHAILDAVSADLPPAQQLAMAKEGSRFVLDTTLRGVYRVLFGQLASPDTIVRLVPRVWASYFDNGTRFTEVVSPGRHDGIVENWGAHHPLLCLMQVHATTPMYEATGAKNVASEQLECVSRGHARCRWSTTWRT